MTVFVARFDDPPRVQLLARAVGSALVGDAGTIVRPGEGALGRSYEEWRDGPAVVEIDRIARPRRDA